MIKWAGWIMVFYASAHTIGSLTVVGAAKYADEWFTGKLWHEDLANMSPAMSALWLSLDSFGPALILIGLLVVWLDRRGVTPPEWLGWALLVLTVVDAAIMLLTPWPLILAANIMLIVGIRRAGRRSAPVPVG